MAFLPGSIFFTGATNFCAFFQRGRSGWGCETEDISSLFDVQFFWCIKSTSVKSSIVKIYIISFQKFNPGNIWVWSRQSIQLREIYPVSIYLLKVNNRNTRTRCEICPKLPIKTLLLTLNIFNFTPYSGVSIVNFYNVIADWVWMAWGIIIQLIISSKPFVIFVILIKKECIQCWNPEIKRKLSKLNFSSYYL